MVILHIIIFVFLYYPNPSLSNDDPSLIAGVASLPLATKAKRLQLETKLNDTVLNTLKPSIDETITTMNPLKLQATPITPMIGQQKDNIKDGKKRNKTTSANMFMNYRWKATTILNDRPLISQLTTPAFGGSSIPATSTVTTLNDLLQSLVPSTSQSMETTTKAAKLAMSFAKHHKKQDKSPFSTPEYNDTPPNSSSPSNTTSSPSLATTQYEQRTRCTQEQSREFINSATTCKNEREDRICSLIFEDPDPKTGRRDPKCNVAGMEDIANSCRRQCGICCEHIDYACEDDSNKIIDCNKQLDKCQMSKWFDVLARFCAGSCGLCTKTACRDYSTKCREMKSLCLDEGHIDFMRANCSRTCGFCVVGPGGASENPLKRLPVPQCIDHASNCTENEALCSSPMHAEFMIKYCAKTCFKCTSDSASSQVIVPIVGTSPELNGTAAVVIPASMIMGAARPDQKECVDHHPKCAIWVAKGFCTHNKYTNEQRFALCPRSCKLC